jgi:hypothetical protein
MTAAASPSRPQKGAELQSKLGTCIQRLQKVLFDEVV